MTMPSLDVVQGAAATEARPGAHVGVTPGTILELVVTLVRASILISPVAVPRAAGTWEATVVAQLHINIGVTAARMIFSIVFIGLLVEFASDVMSVAELVAHLKVRPDD